MTSAPRRRDPPLGATLTEEGCHFAVASLLAGVVEVCLFDGLGREERVELRAGDGGTFRADVAGVRAGQRYGFRADGPVDLERDLRCDPTKLLVDPCARALDGTVDDAAGAWVAGDGTDTSSRVPASLVVDESFDWGDDDVVRPWHPWADTVVYEVHVRGATMRHPAVPDELRGTYAGLAHEAFVAHLVALGVTTVELLPVHELVDEAFLVAGGRTNYWGYNPIGWFAPAQRYSAEVRAGRPGGQVAEFKAMVAALHRAGLEVVLDVVYNHTGEGTGDGPQLSLRGLDAPSYYRHGPDGELVDTTGCGNSINARSPLAVGLVADSLRYWVEACHVDGFRFDLAPTMARPEGAFDPAAPILQVCASDPVLRSAKLIAEPWDLAEEDGFVLGRFPSPFREWNGSFRDTVRDFWRGTDATIGTLATRLAGSSDLFSDPGRDATCSVNYVTSHDGFTLRDLVSYDEKHNEANGQDNEDGTSDNRSWNCGAEGPTDDESVVALRGRQARALLATTLLARGVPMLLGGDELGRTQQGNNNAYCQDNELSWLDWDGVDEQLRAFTTRLLTVRRDHPALRGCGDAQGHRTARVEWFAPDGSPMTTEQWQDPAARCVTMRVTAPSEGGAIDDVLVVVNGFWEQVRFTLPDVGVETWVEVLSTFDPSRAEVRRRRAAPVGVPPRSMLVLRAAGRRRASQRR